MWTEDGRKLLYVQVFNGRQKLLKLSLQTFFSENIWEFGFFHIYIVQEVSAPKMTVNLRGKKSWRLWRKEGNDFLHVVSLT